MANPFFDPINAKLDKRHEEEEGIKKEKRAAMWGIAHSPDSSDEVRNWALGEHQKLLNPETRKKLGMLDPILNQVRGFLGGQRKPATPAPAPTGPMIDSSIPINRAREEKQFESDLIRDRTKDINASKPTTPRGTWTDRIMRTPDGDVPVRVNSATNAVVNQANEPIEIPEGGEIIPREKAAIPDKQYFRLPGESEDDPPHLAYVDRRNPTKRVDVATGQPIPADAKIVDMQTFVAKARGSAYGTGLFNTWTKTFEAQGDSPEEARRKAGPIVEEILTRQAEQIGATRIIERPGIANGQPVAERFQSTPIARPLQNVPPKNGAPVPAPTAPPASSGQPAPAASPASPIAPIRTPAARTGTGPRALTSLPDSAYRQYLNDFRAIRAGATQIFGDPNTPSVKGLVDYSDLADDPKARERLGSALRLTLDGLQQAHSGGGASVGAEGAALNVGGIGTYVGNLLNMPANIATQQAKMLQDAIKSMTPREREAYNATIGAMEGIIGLRAVTRAGAAQSSVRALQEALPVIGVNTSDAAQFKDKANRLAVEFASGTRGIPSNAMDPETRKQIEEINGLPARLNKPTASGSPRKDPAPAPLPVIKAGDKAAFDKLPPGAFYMGPNGRAQKPLK